MWGGLDILNRILLHTQKKKKRILNQFATCKTKPHGIHQVEKKVFSLFSLVTLAMLHSSFNVASLQVNEDANALLNWKASLQNETQPPLPSWNLHNYANNSSNNQNTSSIPCCWLGISCNQARSVIGLNMTKYVFGSKLRSQLILLFSLFLLLFRGFTALFGTIHGSHYTIAAKFYLYQQKIFSFNKISESQTSPNSGLEGTLHGFSFSSLPNLAILGPQYE